MRLFIVFAFTVAFPASVNAADIGNGSKLHSENCTTCHDSTAYTRENRKVQSLPMLQTQVGFCKDNLGLTWFDEEVDDAVNFLNQKYYHF